MALHEATTAFFARLRAPTGPLSRVSVQPCRRHASTTSSASTLTQPTDAAQEMQDMEETPFLATSLPTAASKASPYFNPAANARKRNRRLPPSRYQFRPPRYDRGPMHPHQPPKPSSPSSRLFTPGPFSLPRLEQTYHATHAADFMTLTYMHFPPGYTAPTKAERLRAWQGASPYYANRPLRGPRGGDVLRLLRKPITFRNVPHLEGITVHTMASGAIDDSAYLHVAGLALQSITNVRAKAHAARESVASFNIRAGQYLSVTCELRGEEMYHFLSKMVDVVMPRIKDWRGVKGSSGDSSGNLAFGLKPEEVALFPEIEVNYDMYPPKMIPGCHVMLHTSASTDQDARLLLTQLGIPFYGRLID